ncbi:MAG: GNAT family N-acetyltransferase [Candidatus Izemoplasma sp.]
MNKIILPILETKRLVLRPLSLLDDYDMYEYAAHNQVGPNAGWKPHENISETRDFINYALKKRDYGQPGIYSIILKETKKMIGTIEIHSYKQYKAEIGFVLNPNFWNKGYVTEASKAIIVYAFEVLNLRRLQYGYFLFNGQSKRVCEKLEFKKEGILRSAFQNFDDEVLDECINSITSKDYNIWDLTWLEEFKKTLIVDYLDD